jgi:hypothetical protein
VPAPASGIGKQVDEGVIRTKNDAGAKQRQGKVRSLHGLLQHLLAVGFAALVQRRTLRVGPQSTDVHQAGHAFGFAHLGQGARQLHMHAVKGSLVAMQDGHQIDHRIVATHQGLQLLGVVHIGLNDFNARQHLHAARRQTTGGHGDAVMQAAQRLADMATDEARATEDKNFLRGSGVHPHNVS